MNCTSKAIQSVTATHSHFLLGFKGKEALCRQSI